MKRNILNTKALSVILASVMTVSIFATNTSTAQAAYMTPTRLSEVPYYTGSSVKTNPHYEAFNDVWFKAIYPEYQDTEQGYISAYNNVVKGPALPTSDFGTLMTPSSVEQGQWMFLLDKMTKPLISRTDNSLIGNQDPNAGVDRDLAYDRVKGKIDPKKQYIPTMEFKVGSNIAYVDGKKVTLEAPVKRNAQGKVLIPMYHIGHLLSDYSINYEDSISTDTVIIANPLTVVNPDLWYYIQLNHGVNPDNGLQDGHSPNHLDGRGASKGQYVTEQERDRLDKMYVHDIWVDSTPDGTVYFPASYFRYWGTTVEWNQEKQTATVVGRYTKEALPYGIFSQPGTKSEYDLYKQWEMVPNQPVRVLSK